MIIYRSGDRTVNACHQYSEDRLSWVQISSGFVFFFPAFGTCLHNLFTPTSCGSSSFCHSFQSPCPSLATSPHLTSPSLVALRVGYVKYRRFPSRLHCLRNCCRGNVAASSFITYPQLRRSYSTRLCATSVQLWTWRLLRGTPQQVVAASPHTYWFLPRVTWSSAATPWLGLRRVCVAVITKRFLIFFIRVGGWWCEGGRQGESSSPRHLLCRQSVCGFFFFLSFVCCDYHAAFTVKSLGWNLPGRLSSAH